MRSMPLSSICTGMVMSWNKDGRRVKKLQLKGQRSTIKASKTWLILWVISFTVVGYHFRTGYLSLPEPPFIMLGCALDNTSREHFALPAHRTIVTIALFLYLSMWAFARRNFHQWWTFEAYVSWAHAHWNASLDHMISGARLIGRYLLKKEIVIKNKSAFLKYKFQNKEVTTEKTRPSGPITGCAKLSGLDSYFAKKPCSKNDF